MPGSNHTVAVSRPLPPNSVRNSVIENLWRIQVPSSDGLVRRSIFHTCGPFTAQLQFPPQPGGPDYPPTAIEQFFVLLLALVLIFALVLLVLPEKWSRLRDEGSLILLTPLSTSAHEFVEEKIGSAIIFRSLQRRNMMSDANLLKLNTALLIAVIALLLWGSFWKPQPKAAGRFQPLGEDHFRALDTKTGKLCTTVDMFTSRYNSFTDVQAAGADGSGTFAVPESWDEKHIQSYLDTYRAEDPEGFLRSGRKQFDPLFDRSTMPLPTCASLE